MEFILKYKSLQEIQQNPVWIKLQSKGTDKKQLNEQFLSLTEDEKVIAIDLFESLKVVMEDLLKKNNTQHWKFELNMFFKLFSDNIFESFLKNHCKFKNVKKNNFNNTVLFV